MNKNLYAITAVICFIFFGLISFFASPDNFGLVFGILSLYNYLSWIHSDITENIERALK